MFCIDRRHTNLKAVTLKSTEHGGRVGSTSACSSAYCLETGFLDLRFRVFSGSLEAYFSVMP
jgi:hypothetical protein